MRLKYNTIIVGAGASGLFCAKSLADKKNDVLVLEKLDMIHHLRLLEQLLLF